MSIFLDLLCLAALMAPAAVRDRIIPIHDGARNPAQFADDPRIASVVAGLDRELQRDLQEFAPRRPAATLEDDMAAIEETNDEIDDTLELAERLIDQNRTRVAALRVRLDVADAKIAQQTAHVAALRAKLPDEPAAEKTAGSE